MRKRIVSIKVHDDYGFLDEVCHLFAINKLERADFNPVELHELVKIFVPIVLRQWDASLGMDYQNKEHPEYYQRDLENLELHRSAVFDIEVE